ncbi:MAG: class I SAM-dependent methyltransferase [Acidobacteriota bacterium]
MDSATLAKFGLCDEDFERRVCPVCGDQTEREAFHVGDRDGVGLQTVVCRSCGALFTDPAPTPEALHRFYSESYRTHYVGDPEVDRRRIRVSYRHFRPWLPRTGRLLELGAHDGSFLDLVGRSHPEVERLAVDPDRRSRPADDTIRWFDGLDDAVLSEGPPVDAIVSLHVVEHLRDPAEVLDACRLLLAPGGLLMTEVPNLSRLRQGDGFVHLAHLSHFLPWTFEHLLRRTGFEPVDVWPGRIGRWPGETVLRIVARRASDVPSEPPTPRGSPSWTVGRDAFLRSVHRRDPVIDWLRRRRWIVALYARLLRLVRG